MIRLIAFLIAVLLTGILSDAQIRAGNNGISTPYEPLIGLAGWWSFAGNSSDESGNNFHGTVHEAVLTSDRHDQMDNAYQFIGNSWIDLGDSVQLNLGFTDISVSAWIKTSSIDGARIYSKGTHGGWQPGYAIMVYPNNTGKAALIFCVGGGTYMENILYSDNAVNDNSWHMITGVISRNGTMKMYVDGTLQTQQIDISAFANFDVGADTYNATIGASYCYWGTPNSLNEHFVGKIDEVGVWKRSLSANEIQQMYNERNSNESLTVPNSGFENWSTNVLEVPDNWYIRQVYNPQDEVRYGYSKSTDSYSGNYALKLENILSANDTVYGMIHTLPPSLKEPIQPAFPVSVKYKTLNGYYKFAPANGDSCQFIVWMYNHGYINKQTQNTLGGGWSTRGASSYYIPFSMDINYYDSQNTIPDSACISLSAFKMFDFMTGKKTHPKGNSTVYIDHLSFDGFATEVNTIGRDLKKVSIYPNPATTLLYIDMLLVKSNCRVSLFDLSGRIVKTIFNGELEGKQRLSVPVGEFSPGTYLLLIANDKGFYSSKVVIK